MIFHEDTFSERPVLEQAKRRYQQPKLVVFGKVALLTQGAACSETNDSTACGTGTGGVSMGMVSDRTIKQDIVRVGTHPFGFGLYLFEYKPHFRTQWGHGRRFGVMADEVEVVMPQAVRLHPDGYKMVDYGMLGIRHSVQ